jgi:hypothetical protein
MPATSKPLYKTTLVIWSTWDGSKVEIDRLASEAMDGDAFCAKSETVIVADPESDPDWQGTEFFDTGSIDDGSAPVIRRIFMGGSELQSFAEFAQSTVQDDEMARTVAQRMLDGDTPYAWNADQPEFAETFELLDPDGLRAQLADADEEA